MTTVSRDELIRRARERGVCWDKHPDLDGVRCTELVGHKERHWSQANAVFWDRVNAASEPDGPPACEGGESDSAEVTVNRADSSLPPASNDEQVKRTFETGATRDTDDGKYDYEGFISPLVLREYAAYMHKNRKMRDGSYRSADNWQKGIPLDAYMKSLLRHVMDVWLLHRGHPADTDLVEALCAVKFNTDGYLLELLKDLDRSEGTR